jgi:hypothetical protein
MLIPFEGPSTGAEPYLGDGASICAVWPCLILKQQIDDTFPDIHAFQRREIPAGHGADRAAQQFHVRHGSKTADPQAIATSSDDANTIRSSYAHMGEVLLVHMHLIFLVDILIKERF